MTAERLRKWLGIELIEVSLAERLVSVAGGGLAIGLLVAVSLWALPERAAGGVIASMGASAVLLFAVPHGQLSQPWPVVAGHVLSAAIGVSCARLIPVPALAAAGAVGLAIGGMHWLRCIHPPGGATALMAVIGGEAVADLGYGFVWCPVLLNALAMTLLAGAVNAPFPWRRYPAFLSRSPVREPAGGRGAPPSHEEILAALRTVDSFVDIGEEDLVRLVAALRRGRSAADSPPPSPSENERGCQPPG